EETTLEQSEEDSAADQEKSDAEEATEDNGTEEESISKKQETNTKGNTLADAEEHGFTLELDEILDLDDTAFDEQHPMDPHQEFKLRLNWELEDGHSYVAGDTETFDLPKGIKIQENIEIELTDDSGQV